MEALAEVSSSLENNLWGVRILPKQPDGKLNDLNPAQPDYSKFPKVQTKKHTFEGFKSSNKSIEVTKVEHVPEETSRLYRKGRMVASGTAVGLNILAGLGLVYSSFKLFVSSVFGNGEIESAYRSMGKAYAAGGLAGAVTGIAQESPIWSIGNVLMSVAAMLGLDSRFGLPLHTVGDAFASQGMSNVRYRQKANAIAVRRSVFNNPVLHPFRFLQPIEQSIYAFFNALKSKDGLKSFIVDEPYRLFRRAAGGMISAGGLLGIASLFRNKMSETVSSFFYFPYALLSTVNVIAFGRDGQMELKRINSFRANKFGEDFSRRVEGHAKLTSTPFLGVNNLFLALKGLGIESEGGIMYNLAMVFRSLGAASAMIGFAAQSSLKFFKKVLFGPHIEEVWEARINPKIALENTFRTMHEQESKPLTSEQQAVLDLNEKYKSIVVNDKTCGKILQEIIETDLFKSLKQVTQAGLLSHSNPQAYNCDILNRYDHCIGVGAIGVLVFDEILKNAPTPEIRQNILDYEIAFKIACLIHDARHLARSHVLEKAVEGHDNDELLMWMLKDKSAPISREIVNAYGEDMLGKIREIIGHKHPLFYKVFKDCDRMEYQGMSEYSLLNNPRLDFFKATFNDVQNFARTMRPYLRSDGQIDLSYTENGAVQKLLREYARYMFFSTEHGAFATLEADLPYCIGLAAHPKINHERIKTMSQDEVDKHAQEGLDYIKDNLFSIVLEIISGDESYVGYCPTDENTRIMINSDGHVTEISDWIENSVPRDTESYKKLNLIMSTLRTIRRIKIKALVSNKFGREQGDVTPASMLDDQNKFAHAHSPDYAMAT